MALNPVVLVHGYSDQGASFRPWAAQLAAGGYAAPYHTCTYRSLVNHLTIKDIAEGFDRALADQIGPDTQFDAIVHSTGMLVIRSWLVANPARLQRLKRLVGLAPATFGSPLAQPGRSFIGAIVRGNRDLGPDFLSAGAQVSRWSRAGEPTEVGPVAGGSLWGPQLLRAGNPYAVCIHLHRETGLQWSAKRGKPARDGWHGPVVRV
jgi:pimeloyl-ACP methyl ester carboxylesterase